MPAGFSSSMRVVISYVRQLPGCGLKSFCCARAMDLSGPCDIAAKTGTVADIFRKVRRFMREFPLVAVMLRSRAEIRAHEDELYGRDAVTSRCQVTIVGADGPG